MSWERRRGGSWLCYTRSKRVDGKVVREYVGSGVFALTASSQDDVERASRSAKREAQKQDLEAITAALRVNTAFDHEVKKQLHEAMRIAGFRQHARSTWRRSRKTMENQIQVPWPFDFPEGDSGENVPTTEDLRSFLRDEPVEPSEEIDGLAGRAIDAWLGLLVGSDARGARPIREQLQTFRVGLGAGGSPFEQSLVDQLSICWLECHYFSIRSAEVAHEEGPVSQREFFFRGSERSHRRLAFLLKQLTLIRGLLRANEPARESKSSRGPSHKAKANTARMETS